MLQGDDEVDLPPRVDASERGVEARPRAQVAVERALGRRPLDEHALRVGLETLVGERQEPVVEQQRQVVALLARDQDRERCQRGRR